MDYEKLKCRRTECSHEFEPEHGNEAYCSSECYIKAKRKRQRKHRNGIKTLLNILLNNHKILDELWMGGKREFTEEELHQEGLDTSLCRHLFPNPHNTQHKRLDFGEYFLETENNFFTFKLYKNEPNPR